MRGSTHISSLLRAPLNEDVFTPPTPSPALSLDPDIQELSEQIHRLLLQVRVMERGGGGVQGGVEGEKASRRCLIQDA